LVERVFGPSGAEQPAEDAEADDDSFRAHMRKKARQCWEFHAHATNETTRALAIATLATASIDKLSARAQHLDHHGGAVAEIAGDRGLLFACQRHLWALLNDWDHDARQAEQVAAVKHHLAGDLPALQRQLRRAVLEVGAGVWSRLETRYSSWPWRLIAAAAAGADAAADVHAEFAAEPECCLDSWFSTWLRGLLRVRSYHPTPIYRETHSVGQFVDM
jgi:hypothetical protein